MEHTEWRVRSVETLSLLDGEHVRSTTSWQVSLDPDFVKRFAPDVDRATVLLPLSFRDKRPLLGFDVTCESGTARLLPRQDTAVLHGEYLRLLAETSPGGSAVTAGFSRALLRAICVTTPGPAQNEAGLDPRWHEVGLARHLHRSLQLPVDVRTLRRWRGRLEGAAASLAGALSEPRWWLSSSENVLLALPHLDERPDDIAAIDTIVESYAAAVEAISAAPDFRLLASLAEAGRRWPMLVESEVPLRRQFIVRLAEDRPLSIEGNRRRLTAVDLALPVALDEAATAHVRVRCEDHDVHIVQRHFRATTPLGRDVGIPELESARATDEAFALYASDLARPNRIIIRLRVGVGVRMRYAAATTLLLMASGVGVLTVPAPLSADQLAVVTVPVSVAATFVLTRDETPLAGRLMQRVHALIAGGLLVLWMVALARLLWDDGQVWWHHLLGRL